MASEVRTLLEPMVPSGHTNRTKFWDQIAVSLLEASLVEMTIPGKPRSRNPRYRATETGRGRVRGGL